MAFKDTTLLVNSRPQLFSPANVIRVLDNTTTHRGTLDELSDSNIESTASFKYDSPGAGLKSTQQLSVDFSQFKNHTFFNSAEVNVNVAFDKIINNYPFDGSRREVEAFFESLTGFEKWVYDQFPTNKGFLIFSGSYISVNDFAGSQFPSLSKLKSGRSVLDPGAASISFEFHLFVPATTNHTQIVMQKLSGSNHGISLALSQSSSTSACEMHFHVVSASFGLITSASLTKGQFNHVVATLNRQPGVNKLQLYVNQQLENETTASVEIGQIDFTTSPLIIGSGSTVDFSTIGPVLGRYPANQFVPTNTLSGALDELRIFHGIRTVDQQESYSLKSIYASPELCLYYKFNEPASASYYDPNASSRDTSRIVLDSSGNSLHSVITNYSDALRLTGSYSSNPMLYENPATSPVLFPSYYPVITLNSELLTSASRYDLVNPNIITRLIPQHYLAEGRAFENFETDEGGIVEAYGSGSVGMPGDGELGSSQIISTMLYTWAKFFDEIKLYVDAFSTLQHVEYDDDDTIPSQFLPQLMKHYGFDIPNLFQNSTIEQYIDGDNILDEISLSSDSLSYIQNQVWRRVLSNIQEIIKSKGTVHAVKSFIRAIGVDPDSHFRIREYGGSTSRTLQEVRQNRADVLTSVNMNMGTPVLKSGFLSGSRYEPGFPKIAGSTVSTVIDDLGRVVNLSTNPNDGLFTSGSWTYEAIYQYPIDRAIVPTTQSLVRMVTTGSMAGVLATPTGRELVLANLLALRSDTGTDPKIELVINSNPYVNQSKLALEDIDLFDGNRWNISFGRFAPNDPNMPLIDGRGSSLSSSFFLRAARMNMGEIVEQYVTSSFVYDGAQSLFNVTSTITNARGAYLLIGSQSLDHLSVTSSLGDTRHIQNVSGANAAPAYQRETRYYGDVSSIRFWSRGTSTDEWLEHVRNFKSLGVDNVLTNFNFVTNASGSFGRLRADISLEQETTSSNTSGQISLFDFSQNQAHWTGTGFTASVPIMSQSFIQYSIISPKFDDTITNDKVRVRGLQDLENIEKYGTETSPIYDINPFETQNDDPRFSIDFSVIDALDEDIINIFSSLDELDNALGNPELMFSPDYPQLDNLREIYFNRLTGKINSKAFFEFFKWFDQSIGIFISQLLPKNTKYLGTNFVVESHMLERNRLAYLLSDVYIRQNVRGVQSLLRARQPSLQASSDTTRRPNPPRTSQPRGTSLTLNFSNTTLVGGLTPGLLRRF